MAYATSGARSGAAEIFLLSLEERILGDFSGFLWERNRLIR
jgi:hypothetical protein